MDPSLLLPIILVVFAVLIFMSSRKNKRAATAVQELQRSLQEGDLVMTTSGLRATVVDASYEDTVDLEIAEGVVTTWVRAAVREKVVVPEVEHTDEPLADSPTADAPVAVEDVPASPAPSFEKTPSLDKAADPASDASRN